MEEKCDAEKAREAFYNDPRCAWITPWENTSQDQRDAWNRVVNVLKKES